MFTLESLRLERKAGIRVIGTGQLRRLLEARIGRIHDRKWSAWRKMLNCPRVHKVTRHAALCLVAFALAPEMGIEVTGAAQAFVGVKSMLMTPAGRQKAAEFLSMCDPASCVGKQLAQAVKNLVPGCNPTPRALYRWAKEAGDRYSVTDEYGPERIAKIATVAARGKGKKGRPKSSEKTVPLHKDWGIAA